MGSSPLSPTIFACGKNGERSRKASLHAASVALHSKPKVFFTSSRIPGSLACEAVSLRCRFIALVKPLRNSGLCLALLDFQSALLWLKPLSLRLWSCRLSAEGCVTFTARLCRLVSFISKTIAAEPPTSGIYDKTTLFLILFLAFHYSAW